MRRVAILTGMLGLLVLGLAATPAEAHDGWSGYGYGYNGWREQAWREHEWRQHAWREHHRFWHPWSHYGYYGARPGVTLGFNFP